MGRLRGLDLFAGAGGLSCGFEWAGGRIVGAVEVDDDCVATFRHNHPRAKVWATDIRSLSPRSVKRELGRIDIVLGGPMCQGVSQRGPRDPHDPRNFAFWTFIDFVRELRPDYFLMENVPALVSDVHNRSLAIEVFKSFESLGYNLSAEVVNAAWFGVPQLRHRLIVLGSRRRIPTFPPNVGAGVTGALHESDFVTVDEAISDLPLVRAGGGIEVIPMPRARGEQSAYVRMLRSGARSLFNHWSADTEKVNLDRIRHVPEGGNWHNIPTRLLPPRFRHVRPSDHTTTYRRLDRRHPAHTVTTECGNVTSGAYTHPLQNRAITVREAARLQGFPDRYRFMGRKQSQYRQVGNAVPALLAREIVKWLIRPGAGGTVGRITPELLRAYPDSRLPFTLSPRYRPLFGRSTWAAKHRAVQLALGVD